MLFFGEALLQFWIRMGVTIKKEPCCHKHRHFKRLRSSCSETTHWSMQNPEENSDSLRRFRHPHLRGRPHRRYRSEGGLSSAMSVPFRNTRRASSSRTDNLAIITLFKRDSSPDSSIVAGSSSLCNDDIVSMSEAGQRIIPAKFNLQPISEPRTSTNLAEGGKEFSQAGGHKGSFTMDGDTLVKRVTDREMQFYEDAQRGAWPASLLPRYYGRVGNDGIKIENLTHDYSRPCVIDLKMGEQTVESGEGSLLKQIRMKVLDHVTRSRSEGCRLEGLSMYRTLEKRFVKGTKRQTHSISANVRVSIQDVLTFFLTDETGVRSDIALRFQTAIEQILEQFKRNREYMFIGSSILLIYDNDNRAPYMHWARALRKLHTIAPHVRLSEDQISGLTRRTRCDVRMIDFAHTGPLPPGKIKDDGYIHGLETILKALRAIRIYRQKPIFSFQLAAIDMMEEHRAKVKAAQESGEIVINENFTFGTVLKELTAVSHALDDDSSSSLLENRDSYMFEPDDMV